MPTPVRGSRRRLALAIGGAVAAVALGVGLALFQPWLLFVDVRVDEALPEVAPTPAPTAASPDPEEPEPAPRVLASGEFLSQEHTTTGSVAIIEHPDGSRVLAISGLDTSNGPDLHVWLSAADAVSGYDGWFLAGGADFHDLGPLKGNQGDQLYDIPAEVDLGRFRSVSIWCVRFSVGFGAAQLA